MPQLNSFHAFFVQKRTEKCQKIEKMLLILLASVFVRIWPYRSLAISLKQPLIKVAGQTHRIWTSLLPQQIRWWVFAYIQKFFVCPRDNRTNNNNSEKWRCNCDCIKATQLLHCCNASIELQHCTKCTVRTTLLPVNAGAKAIMKFDYSRSATANCRKRAGREGKGVVFSAIMIAWCEFNPHSGHVVASMDKTLYDDYLYLEASNKQQIQRTRLRKNLPDYWITGNS